MNQTVETIISFVGDKQNGGSDIISHAANVTTGDFWLYLVVLLSIIGLAASIVKIFAQRKSYADTFGKHYNISSSKYSLKKNSIIIAFLTLVLAVSGSILMGKTNSALAADGPATLTPKVQAVVNDEGSVSINSADLTIGKTEQIVKYTGIETKLLDEDVSADNLTWTVGINQEQIYNDKVPGSAKGDIELASDNKVNFSVSNMSSELAKSLIGKDVVSVKLTIEEVKPPAKTKTLTLQSDSFGKLKDNVSGQESENPFEFSYPADSNVYYIVDTHTGGINVYENNELVHDINQVFDGEKYYQKGWFDGDQSKEPGKYSLDSDITLEARHDSFVTLTFDSDENGRLQQGSLPPTTDPIEYKVPKNFSFKVYVDNSNHSYIQCGGISVSNVNNEGFEFANWTNADGKEYSGSEQGTEYNVGDSGITLIANHKALVESFRVSAKSMTDDKKFHYTFNDEAYESIIEGDDSYKEDPNSVAYQIDLDVSDSNKFSIAQDNSLEYSFTTTNGKLYLGEFTNATIDGVYNQIEYWTLDGQKLEHNKTYYFDKDAHYDFQAHFYNEIHYKVTFNGNEGIFEKLPTAEGWWGTYVSDNLRIMQKYFPANTSYEDILAEAESVNLVKEGNVQSGWSVIPDGYTSLNADTTWTANYQYQGTIKSSEEGIEFKYAIDEPENWQTAEELKVSTDKANEMSFYWDTSSSKYVVTLVHRDADNNYITDKRVYVDNNEGYQIKSVVIPSPNPDHIATLTMEEIQDTYDVSWEPAVGGMVTDVDGNTPTIQKVPKNTSISITEEGGNYLTINTDSEYKVQATASEGYTFIGWMYTINNTDWYKLKDGDKIFDNFLIKADFIDNSQLVVPEWNGGEFIYNNELYNVDNEDYWTSYSSKIMQMSGAISAKDVPDANGHIVTFTPKPGFTWKDGTSDTKSVPWFIYPKNIIIDWSKCGTEDNPYVKDWDGEDFKVVAAAKGSGLYDDDSAVKVSIGEQKSKDSINIQDAGIYNASASIEKDSKVDPNYKIVENENVTYTINQLNFGDITLDLNSVSLIVDNNPEIELTATLAKPSADVDVSEFFSADSGDENIASVEILSTTVGENVQVKLKVKAVAGGDTKLIVACENKNFKYNSIEIPVNVDLFNYGTIATNAAGADVYLNKYVGAQTITNKDVEVPASVSFPNADGVMEEHKVTSIGKGGDAKSKIFSGDTYCTRLVLPSTVTAINKYAFYCTEIEQVKNVSTISTIAMYAFNDCANLTQFGNTANTITTPSVLTDLGTYAFANCQSENLNKINISASTNLKDNTIQTGCFNACTYVTDVRIPSNVTTISNYAFKKYNYSTTNILYGKNSSGTNIAVLDGAASNPTRFEISSSINPNVKVIAAQAFNGCSTLNKVVIDRTSQIYVNDSAFSSCRNLETMFVKSTPITYGNFVLSSSGSGLTNSKKLVVGGNKGTSGNMPTGIPASALQYQQKQFDGNTNLTEANTYYWLAGGWTNVGTLQITANCALDLCGYKISGHGPNNGRVFHLDNHEFTLLDTSVNASTSSGGQITNGYGASGQDNMDGGVLQTDSGTVKIYDGYFYQNGSYNGAGDGQGGALALGGVHQAQSATMYIYNGLFSNNVAYEKGGTIFVGSGCKLNMYGGQILSSKAEEKGGAIYSQAAISLQNVTIKSAKSSGQALTSCDGGAIYLEAGNSSFNSCTINQNTADNNAGAIYVNNNSSLTLSNCTVDNNIGAQGGGIYLSDNAQLTMTGGSISSNESTQTGSWGGGGVMMAQGSKFIFNSGKINNNTTGAHGGGVYVRGGSSHATLYVNGGEMSGNKCNKTKAGGIYLQKVTFFPSGEVVWGAGVDEQKFIIEE